MQSMNHSHSLFEQHAAFTKIPLPDADLSFTEHFYAPAIADQLFSQLLKEIDWRQEHIQVWGKLHLQPRLTAWHGDSDAEYSYSGICLTAQPWTKTLLKIKNEISLATGQKFNSVLLNQYRDQNDSMGWHSDDEASLGHNPTIASLSLGATRTFKIKHKAKPEQKTLSINLTHGCLLLMAGSTQHHYQHSIAKQSRTLGSRINLTFRQISFP